MDLRYSVYAPSFLPHVLLESTMAFLVSWEAGHPYCWQQWKCMASHCSPRGFLIQGKRCLEKEMILSILASDICPIVHLMPFGINFISVQFIWAQWVSSFSHSSGKPTASFLAYWLWSDLPSKPVHRNSYGVLPQWSKGHLALLQYGIRCLSESGYLLWCPPAKWLVFSHGAGWKDMAPAFSVLHQGGFEQAQVALHGM